MSGRTRQELFEDLVLALLAVNSWSLDKVYSLHKGLASAGLFSQDTVARSDVEAIAQNLRDAGYKRGPYLEALIANRLKDVSRSLSTERLDGIGDCLARGDRQCLEELMMPLKGVGPVVIEHLLILQEGSS